MDQARWNRHDGCATKSAKETQHRICPMILSADDSVFSVVHKQVGADELRTRVSNGQHRTRRVAHDPFGGAAQQNVFEAAVPVRPHDNQVRAGRLGGIGNLGLSSPHPDEGLDQKSLHRGLLSDGG